MELLTLGGKISYIAEIKWISQVFSRYLQEIEAGIISSLPNSKCSRKIHLYHVHYTHFFQKWLERSQIPRIKVGLRNKC